MVGDSWWLNAVCLRVCHAVQAPYLQHICSAEQYTSGAWQAPTPQEQC
jgi:hypothetical protein